MLGNRLTLSDLHWESCTGFKICILKVTVGMGYKAGCT